MDEEQIANREDYTWFVMQIEQLRADIEEAEIAKDEAIEEAEDYLNIAEDWQHKYKKYKAELDDAQNKINMELRDKLMLYLSLINEYEISILVRRHIFYFFTPLFIDLW